MAYSYGAQPIQNPPVPFTTPIPGGCCVGKTIHIEGFVPHHAERFQINIRSRHSPSEDKLFHFNPRWLPDGRMMIVCNTCSNNEWGPEENHDQVLQKGERFEITIRPEDHCYMISANGQHVCEYHHRVSVHSGDELTIEGDVQITMIRFEPMMKRDPPMPFVDRIPGGAVPGRHIWIDGEIVHGSRGEFIINLKSGTDFSLDNIAFHFNPRFQHNEIVRNSCTDGEWGTEEKHLDLPMLQPGMQFNICILVDNNDMKLSVNGQHYVDFRHRQPLHMIDSLMIDGDVQLHAVKYE